MKTNALILGASYGSLFGTKLLLAGHSVSLVCTQGTADLINREGTVVRFPIRLYQSLISPALGSRCKYYPSCSEYAAQAIGRFGIPRGLVLAGWRLLRCNPWSHGGFDPVEDQRLFKSQASAPAA